MILFFVGLLTGIAIAVCAIEATYRYTLAHPDESLCMTCNKVYNTVRKSAQCPHKNVDPSGHGGKP